MVSDLPHMTLRVAAYPTSLRPLSLGAWVTPGALAACALTLVYAVDPRASGNYPPCLFLYITGCYCPGCGALRALHSLLHGNLRDALGYNLLTVALLPFLASAYVYGFARQVSQRRLPNLRVSRHVAWTALVAILAFWVMRNVTVVPLSVLAP